MNRLLFIVVWLAAMVSSGLAQTAAGPNEGSRLARDASTGIYSLYWWGHSGNTYFIQHSEDLTNWFYFPEIKTGADAVLGENFQTNANKFFVRLRMSSISTNDPFNADFDGDHVSNQDELLHGTDPLSSQDTDNNSLPDDWEIRYFGHLGVNPNADADGDGVSNFNEYLAFSDPTDPTSCPYQVTRFTPDDQQQGHPANSVILLYLNKPLPSSMSSLPTGIVTHTADLGATWQPVSGTWLVLPGRKTVAFFPAGDFLADAVGVEDYTYRVNFTAATTGLSPVVPLLIRFSAGEPDSIGAWVRQVWPANDYVDVATDFAPVVQWSEPLRPDTATDSANVSLRPEGGTSDLPITLSFDYFTNRLTITPAALLLPDTVYHVTLGTGFNNLKSLPLSDVYKWSFQTRPAPPPPGAGPHITATNPAAYAENVAITAGMDVAFSEAMNATTLSASTVHLRAYGGTEDVNATFAYNAVTHHLEVTPVSPLFYETPYALTFDGPGILSSATNPQTLGGSLRLVFATVPDPNNGGGGGPGGGGPRVSNPLGAGNPKPEKPKPMKLVITYDAVATSGGLETGGYVTVEAILPDGTSRKSTGPITSKNKTHIVFKVDIPANSIALVVPKKTSVGVGVDPQASPKTYGDGSNYLACKQTNSVIPMECLGRLYGASYTFSSSLHEVGNLLPVELITPSGDPVNKPVDAGTNPNNVPDGANEFTFSDASPGVLTIKLKAKMSGISNLEQAIKDRFKFDVDATGSSTMAWDAANPGGKPTATGDLLEAKVTFTGLPEHNADFGKKKARVLFDDLKAVEKGFEIYFPKAATNHPPTGGLSTQPPNWFYYWQEDKVCGIPADGLYDSQADYGYVLPGVDKKLRLGPLAADSNNGPETFTNPTSHASLTVTGHGKGIQCVAETAEHELNHLTIFDDARGKVDSDGDGVADSSEYGLNGVNSDPNDGDTFHMRDTYGAVYSSYGDNEIRCRKKELTLTIKYFPKQDWANPGCQSKNQFGPQP